MKTRENNIELTICEMICIIGFLLVIGILIGSVLMKQSCDNTIEFIAGTYKDILFKVSDMDINTIITSYEYCEKVILDPEFNQSIKIYESIKK